MNVASRQTSTVSPALPTDDWTTRLSTVPGALFVNVIAASDGGWGATVSFVALTDPVTKVPPLPALSENAAETVTVPSARQLALIGPTIMLVWVPRELVTGEEPETAEQVPPTPEEVKRTESSPVSAGAAANPTST